MCELSISLIGNENCVEIKHGILDCSPLPLNQTYFLLFCVTFWLYFYSCSVCSSAILKLISFLCFNLWFSNCNKYLSIEKGDQLSQHAPHPQPELEQWNLDWSSWRASDVQFPVYLCCRWKGCGYGVFNLVIKCYQSCVWADCPRRGVLTSPHV